MLAGLTAPRPGEAANLALDRERSGAGSEATAAGTCDDTVKDSGATLIGEPEAPNEDDPLPTFIGMTGALPTRTLAAAPADSIDWPVALVPML
jgi:hypothetical protein